MESVICDAVGVIDGLNDEFDTIVAYTPGTVFAYLNGQLLPRDDGLAPLTELGGTRVRLGEAPRTNDRVHFWFQTGTPTPGNFPRPPLALRAIELRPRPVRGLDLAPRPVDSSGGGATAAPLTPGAFVAIELRPAPEASIVLAPKPVGAEEV